MRASRTFGGIIAAVALLAGCAGTGGRLPAVAAGTQTDAAGAIVWCDLLSDDLESASAFYEKLLGWEYVHFSRSPAFRVAYAGKRPVAGLTVQASSAEGDTDSLWICSVSVDDVDAVAARAAEQGGEVIERPWNAAPRGRVAVIADPLEAPVALLQTNSGHPSRRIPIGAWSWFDYFATEPDRAGEFYESVLGYRVVGTADNGRSLELADPGGMPLRAAIVDLGELPVESNWVPYVRVGNLSETLAKVDSLGGRVLLVVNDAAVIEDPSGAAIGLHGPLQGAGSPGRGQ